MADRTSLSQRIQEYQPSKTVLFWSGAACVATTMIASPGAVGHRRHRRGHGGGRRRPGPRRDRRCDLEEFMRQADAGVQFASLKEISSSWRREDFVEEGGWAMVADEEYDNAAELCPSV